MPLQPLRFTETALSFRWDGQHLVCAYVSTVGVERDGQQALIESKHLSGIDEVLVDLALQEVRSQVLEHTLTRIEPF